VGGSFVLVSQCSFFPVAALLFFEGRGLYPPFIMFLLYLLSGASSMHYAGFSWSNKIILAVQKKKLF
jgi:hypothetical protein